MIAGLDRIDLRDIVGVRLHRCAENEYAGPCPRSCPPRKGGHDRFHVKLDNGVWWWFCRQCHAQSRTGKTWSDAIEFIEWRDGVDFDEAKKRLLGAVTSFSDQKKTSAHPRDAEAPEPLNEPPSQEQQQAMRAFAMRCMERLYASDAYANKARQWLYDRGLSDDTIAAFWLGVNPSPEPGQQPIQIGAAISATTRGFTIPHLYDGHIWRVRIRRFTKDMDADRLRGRDKADKYKMLMGVGGGKTVLYGADDLLNDIGIGVVTTVVICAGEYDALLLRQHAPGHVAVVTPGSESGTSVRQEWIGLMSRRRVIVCMDADATGGAAAQRWRSAIPRAEVVVPPNSAKDITDAWKTGADLGSWLANIT